MKIGMGRFENLKKGVCENRSPLKLERSFFGDFRVLPKGCRF